MAKSFPDVAVPDVQSSIDTRQWPINRVGIRAIRHPLLIVDQKNIPQPTVVEANLYVGLPKEVKGTHMSRFVELLHQQKAPLSVTTFPAMLREMVQLLGADSGRIELSFPYFLTKAAPVSKVESLLDYAVTWIGEISQDTVKVMLKVAVPVTSLCPCSKKVSDYGAHNQRSCITVTITTSIAVWITELIQLVEAEASCDLYGILKRPDEKYVTERAYDNPKFVEDLVRDVAAKLDADQRITGFIVESENFESIHNHSAYAMIYKGMEPV